MGWRGHGKTMLAVERARALAARRGVVLLANIWVSDAPVSRKGRPLRVERIPAGRVVKAGKPAPIIDMGWLIDRLYRLIEAKEGCVLLLDEAGSLFNSRNWQTFPDILGYLMGQGRKARTDVVYTAQFIDQVDKLLRELTEVAHKVRCWPAPTVLGRETGRRPWLMVASTYRPAQVDQGEKRLGRAWMIYRRRRERVYDTDDFVLPVRPQGSTGPDGGYEPSSGGGHGSPGPLLGDGAPRTGCSGITMPERVDT